MNKYMKFAPLVLLVAGYVAKKMVARAVESEGITVTLDIMK